MACMHCTDAPCAAVCPVNCFYTTADARGAALQGPLHRLRLLLLRLPVRRAAISEGRQFRLARQDGQVHLLRRRPGSRRHARKSTRSTAPTAWPKASCRCAPRCARPSRCSPATARSSPRSTRSAWSSAATAPAPGAGRPPIARRSRPDQARRCGIAAPPVRSKTLKQGEDAWRSLLRICASIAGALALAFIVAIAAPASAQQPNSVNPTAECGEGAAAAQQLKTIQGRGTIPGREVLHARAAGRPRLAAVPRGDAALDRRHRHPRHAGAARRLLSVARHGEDRERPLRPHDRALQRVRALRALDDGDLLHHPGDLRPQHHVRPAAAAAADRARRRSRPGRNGRNTPTTI